MAFDCIGGDSFPDGDIIVDEDTKVVLLKLGHCYFLWVATILKDDLSVQYLVNVKLKWVKDKALDAAVAGQRELQAACILVFIIFSHSHGYVPIYHLSRYCRQRDAAILQGKEREKSGCLAFPIRFSRGFGLKKKCMKWLQEWQELPYTSPYSDALQMDPRTDVSEKRIVGVFHELLHLTIQKKTERKNVSNLRRPLSLPQKFTKVFERHPGIFYISKKSDTQTVILREAYDGQQLLEKHPLVEIRERYDAMMRVGFLDRSRGFYKKDQVLVSWGISNINYEHMEESHHGNQPVVEGDSNCGMLSTSL
ncbi:hypothetical protein Nepgr_013061 [Nepenthes gracilis]|uniref:PORR domain-containing protein n=1 Tax=Nepenthes gracilis TaxID=150966 RepID=A0AAD3XP13_NEPGR|nr:hypothetical protein Nepgr_013061 [Nepenthes gracilis]